MDHADYAVLRFVNSIDDDGKTRDDNAFRDHESLLVLLKDPAISKANSSSVEDMVSFREALFAVFSALAASETADPRSSETVRNGIELALSHVDLSIGAEGLRLLPGRNSTQIDVIALSAYDLMTSPDFARLKECHRCTRLFIDRGRGKGRRWCDMARCGNRAKAESYRARKRAEGDAVR